MFMKYDPQIHHRRSIRLKGYDYSQSGLYFITLCIQNRECLLGEIEHNLINLNPAGGMVKQIWQQLPRRFPYIQIDEFVVMPNHLHGIILISMFDSIPGDQIQRKVKLGDVVGAFKSVSTHQYIQGVQKYNWQGFQGKLWQRNYHEHIIRDEASLNNIRQYILDNPRKWEDDPENPAQTTKP
jgi:REP element-mobilizing transposase RayT